MLSSRHTLVVLNDFQYFLKLNKITVSRINDLSAKTQSIKFSSNYASSEYCIKKINSNWCTKNFLKARLNYNESKRNITVIDEFKKLYEETSSKYFLNQRPFQIRDPRDTLDMLFTFENEDSLRPFVVTTDSSSNAGYSSASLKITQDRTALFSGYLSTEVPKTGEVRTTGFVNMMSNRRKAAFNRKLDYDFTYYTHLVLKIRGDGRSYAVIIPTIGDLDVTKGLQYGHPLWTRGGPYWQITKIPFSHFAHGYNGKLLDVQEQTLPLRSISKVGITLADSCDGPFRLEIDYIGLESDKNYRNISPYESYYVGNRFT